MSTIQQIINFHQSLTSPPIQEINSSLFTQAQIKLFVLRSDLIHPTIKGNKWFKLHYNLLKALQQNHDTILTFGGAYSNHIYATAAAGQLFGLKTIGLIRGEEHLPLNPILTFAQSAGMTLHYISRQNYRMKHTESSLKSFQAQYGPCYIIPEGGANLEGIRGCLDLVPSRKFDYLCCACGTGGTLAGLIAGSPPETMTLGVPVLKGGDFLYQDVKKSLDLLSQTYPDIANDLTLNHKQWTLICDFHFGGYAKKNQELQHFIEEFQYQHNIPIEPVYTGKLFYGLYQKIKEGYFKAGSSILAIHSGGVYNHPRV